MSRKYFAFTLLIVILITGFINHHGHYKNEVTTIHFKNWIGDKELKLFDETYTDPFGEPFVVTKFRYYVSNISYTGADNKEIILQNNYFLINEDDSLSKIIELPVTGIKSISFLIGVDSIKNISGVQTGSLDPMNGMFWTWNSGYVFAKLEGQSDSSHAPAHSFSWDVGGFRQKENALRKIALTLPVNNSITINADVLKWFNAMHPLKISQLPICHQPGKLAMQIADNYSTMFSVSP